MIGNVILNIFLFVLDYIGGIFKTFIFIIIFGFVTMLIVGTGLETPLVNLFSITPGIGLGKHGNFIVNQDNIMIFFLLWGGMVSLISNVIKKFTKIKIKFSGKELLLFGLALHVVFLIIFSIRFGFVFSIMFIGISLATYLLSLFFFQIINLVKQVLDKFITTI